MNSMTGYGKGIAEKDLRKVTVEIRSVNHRFLDLNFKLPRGFQFAEDAVRKAIGAHIKRGHLDIFVNYENTRQDKAEIRLNADLAKQYLDASKELVKMGYVDDFGTAAAMRIPDLLTVADVADDEEEILKLVVEATSQAVASLVAMRRSEGGRLIEDLKGKLKEMWELVAVIEERAPLVPAEYRQKLEKRMKEALGDVAVDEARLLNEVAFFVDKANIDEEITRLKGHLKHYEEILASQEAMGKKLDFLTQEANREVNTMGSKSNDTKITETVLRLKNVVEMVREQIQNLE